MRFRSTKARHSEDAEEPIFAPAGEHDESTLVSAVRWQIWIYLVLWILEGALRKWYLPSLSNILLVVRDPLAILIYATALSANRLPINGFIVTTVLLAFVSFGAGFLVTGNLLLTTYGVRSNFLHLPLIYVMAQVLRPTDLKRMGMFFLTCSVPMALIMGKQFNSSMDDWWNLGAGGGRQIISDSGKIRPAGTFSFISGPICFFSIVASYLLASAILKKWFRWWTILAATCATVIAASVSGSRTMLSTLVIVSLLFLLGCSKFPPAFARLKRTVGGVLLALLLVSGLDVFREGTAVTSSRATGATRNEGGFSGFLNRAIKPLLITPEKLGWGGLLGKGIGTGTVAAATLANSPDQAEWAEEEWDRVLLESGPILGLAYLGLRVAMTLSALAESLRASRLGNLLPIALFGAGGYNLLTGQFGQPTSQGGATIAMGLCLGALSLTKRDTVFADASETEDGAVHSGELENAEVRRRRGRAPYAESLHRQG